MKEIALQLRLLSFFTRDIRELQKMNAFTIVSVFSYICLLASLALNVLLMLVVSRYSAKYLIPYRRPLLITAMANLGLSVCFMLLQPVGWRLPDVFFRPPVEIPVLIQTFVLRQGIVFVVLLGPMGLISHNVCVVFMVIYVSLFIFASHQSLLVFFFRYAFIFR